MEVLPFQIAHDPVGKMLPSQFWPAEQNPRTVGISIAILSISGIDIINHQFQVHVRAYLDWPATVEECKQYWMRNQEHFSVLSRTNSASNSFLTFQPWTKFAVVAQDAKIAREWTEPKLCYVDKHDRYFIKLNAEFRCTCVQNFNLERFPCDIQDLSIMFQLGTGSRSSKWAQLVPIHSRPVIAKIERRHCMLDEYTFDQSTGQQHVYTFFQNSDPKESSVYCSTSSFRVVIKLQRKWHQYFFRVGLVLSMLSLGCNMVFFFEEDNFGVGVENEIAYINTLLFSGIAYMFIVHSDLPHIPHLTYIDYYSNAQFLYMICLLSAICLTTKPDEGIDWTVNSITFIFSITMWVFVHLVLFVWFARGSMAERQKLFFFAEDYSTESASDKTISLPNVSKNWKFGHRYPGASKDDLVKGPRRYLESFKHLYSRQSLLLEWNGAYDDRMDKNDEDSIGGTNYKSICKPNFTKTKSACVE